MNAPLIFDEHDRDQNEYDDERDALFILRKFENPEQTFHEKGQTSDHLHIDLGYVRLTPRECSEAS